MAPKSFQKSNWKTKEETATEKRHWVRLTKVCNNNCIFCLDKDHQDGTIIPFSAVVKDLEKGLKRNCVRAILSGGEPTIHPDYIKIIKRAKGLGYGYIQTVTNGRMFAYRNFLEACIRAGLDEITFTLPGHNKKLFEAQTRRKGSFAQTVKGVINALRTRLIVSSDIVITKFTYKCLLDIIKFYVKLGVREFDLLQVMPYSNAWRYKESVLYNVEAGFPYLKKVFDYTKKVNFFIWTNRFPPHFLEGYEELIQDPHKLHSEVKGRQTTFENIIKGKEEMFLCYPKRCPYCFWKDFAKTIIKLRKIRNNPQELKTLKNKRIKKGVVIKTRNDLKKLRSNQNHWKIFINKETKNWILRNLQKLKKMKDLVTLNLENQLLLSGSKKNDINLKEFFKKINIPHLRIENIPLCFYPQGKLVKREVSFPPIEKKEVDIHEVVDWFIENIYYTKSLRCKKCKFFKDCPGMHINYIRNFGYKIISPIKNNL